MRFLEVVGWVGCSAPVSDSSQSMRGRGVSDGWGDGSFVGNLPMGEKPEKCPRCGSSKFASILYGLPMFDDELKRGLDSGEIVIGGCDISSEDPLWLCAECDHRWGERDQSSSGA